MRELVLHALDEIFPNQQEYRQPVMVGERIRNASMPQRRIEQYCYARFCVHLDAV